MKNAKNFLYISMLLIFLASCKDDPVRPEDPDPVVEISSPKAEETYWNDRPVNCAATTNSSATEWLVDGNVVPCVGGELDTSLSVGEHTVVARGQIGGQSVEDAVKITVKEGFAVTLVRPEDGAEYFVGEKLACEAVVEPARYESNLEIAVGGRACTDGTAEIQESGEVVVVASVTIDSRTEADAATVVAKPVVAGRVYPLTDQGVSSQADGFTVTLKAGGEVTAVETDSDGSFTIKSDRFAELPADELVTLEVAATGSFYGARADRTSADELQAYVAADELGFILAPKYWRIRCGPLAGKATTIKLPEAFTRYDPERQYSSFYMYFDVFGTNMYRKLLPKDRPLLTAFNRAESDVAITAADSSAFWAETERVEAKICRGDLFNPATIDEVPTRDDGVQVMSTNDRPLGGARTNDDGHIIGGGILLPIDDFGGKDGYQAHELTQVLGFGETSEWVGVMSSGQFSGDHDFTTHSVDDIVHIQLYMDAVDLQFEQGISFGIYQWRRMFDIPSLPDN